MREGMFARLFFWVMVYFGLFTLGFGAGMFEMGSQVRRGNPLMIDFDIYVCRKAEVK